MNNSFLFLNEFNSNTEIIIGINSIAFIEHIDAQNGTAIELNYARNSDLWPKKIYVKQSVEEIGKQIKG